MRAQTRQVFEAVGALLADRGATFTDVVNIRTYLADMSRLREYSEAHAERSPVRWAPPTRNRERTRTARHPTEQVGTGRAGQDRSR